MNFSRGLRKHIPVNPSSLNEFILKVQEQKSMYKVTMLLRMRAHRTPLKKNLLCEVTTEPPVGGELVNTIKNNKYMSNYREL